MNEETDENVEDLAPPSLYEDKEKDGFSNEEEVNVAENTYF